MRNSLKWAKSNSGGLYGGLIFLIMIIILISILNIAFAATFKLLIDIATKEVNTALLLGVVLAIFTSVLIAITSGLQSYMSKKIGLAYSKKIKIKLLKHIELIPSKDIDKYHSGELLTRLTLDTEQASSFVTEGIFPILLGGLSYVFALVYAFTLNWKMALITVILSPLSYLWGKYLVPKLQGFAQKEKEYEEKTRGFMQEQLNNISVIKCNESYEFSIRKASQYIIERIKNGLLFARMQFIFQSVSHLLGISSFVIALAMGSYFVSRGEATVGTIISFAQVLNYIVWPFTMFPTMIARLQTKIVSINRINEISSIEIEEGNSGLVEVSLNNEIEQDVCLNFENVYFSYDGENDIISGLNTVLKKGEIIGLVGESGVGKSTFVRLLLALYEADQGKVYISFNNSKIYRTGMRKHIAYVPQDHVLFSGSVAENIKYSNVKATQGEIEAAAKKANAHDFIMELPNCYETIISEGGKNLSFGQAQRIAISRAILKDAPVLVLDEPTASIDEYSETLILKTLEMEKQNRLCIVVTHNPSIYNKCDRVLFFEDGIITEKEIVVLS